MPVSSATRWLGRAALAVALASGVGCRLLAPPQGPSHVAQGRYFSTGNPNYDEFFVRLYRMQIELKAAPETLTSIRQDLAKSVALEPAAGTDQIRSALGTKATEMSGRGAAIAVDRAREPGERTQLAITGMPAQADRPLVKALEDVLARLGELRERSGPWQKELDWLPPAGVALDGSVEAAFVGRSRATRDEVHENLTDAQKVVALMAARKKEIEANSAEIEELFVSAFGAKKSEPAPAPAAPPAPKPRPRAAPAPRPAAAPAPESDGPAPATKPKQGTARPDFEP
jgi:hypothetical protein